MSRLPLWYVALTAAVGAQRLRELSLSRRNSRALIGRRAAARSYPLMVAAHVGLVTLPLVEAAALRRRSRVAWLWLGLLGASTLLRWWTIRTLGQRWNVQAIVPTDLRPATGGPYRFLRHPNYLAVALEFLALPMAGGAFVSAVGLSLLNAAVLFDRIREEERLLAQVPGYSEAFRGRARLVPGLL